MNCTDLCCCSDMGECCENMPEDDSVDSYDSDKDPDELIMNT